MVKPANIVIFLIFAHFGAPATAYTHSDIPEYEKRKNTYMVTGSPFRAASVCSLSRAPLRVRGAFRIHSPALRRQDCHFVRIPEAVVAGLDGLYSLEHSHHFLGLQCHSWRRNHCNSAELPADACRLGTLQAFPQVLQRQSSLHFLRCGLDSLGKGLFCSGHILALAHPRQCLRQKRLYGSVV